VNLYNSVKFVHNTDWAGDDDAHHMHIHHQNLAEEDVHNSQAPLDEDIYCVDCHNAALVHTAAAAPVVVEIWDDVDDGVDNLHS